jgi:uncharacterized protein (UPF0333 family)
MLIKKGQSMLEYTLLFSLILAALVIMQFYIKRAYQGRLKQDADEVGQQYSPGHTVSLIQSYTGSRSTTYAGGEVVADDGSRVKVPYGMTVTKSSTNNSMTKQEGVDSFAHDN